MDPTVFIGVLIGVTLLIQSIGIETGIKLFLHGPSLLIVLGGTLGATMVHFPLTQLIKIGSRMGVVFSLKSRNYQKDINQMLTLSQKMTKDGRMALNNELKNIKDHFLRNALQMLIDRVPERELEGILRENIYYMQTRHDLGIKFFEQLAKYAPGFGMIGTLIGLILMLSSLDDPSSVGPKMAVALITTFYGVLFSNLLFVPIAGRLKIASNEESVQKEMYVEGILGMAREESGYIIREKMAMLLPERERKKLEKAAKKK